MSALFHRLSDEHWRTFVADIAEALELREGDRVFAVHCGTGALLRPLYEAGCAVGGSDPDPRLVEIARRDMPRGEWSAGDDQAPGGTAWDVVLACSVLDALWSPTDAAALLEQMVRRAGAALAILDVPEGLAFDQRWFLRTLSALGVASVRLPALRIPGYDGDGARFNVIARKST